MKTAPSNKQGFSLIEILVFVSVFSVALVALIGSASYSALILSNLRYKTYATRYSEELAEWLSFQRNYQGYSVIEAKQGNSYCFNDSSIDVDNWPSAGACTGFTLNDFYKRQAVIEASGTKNKITITTSYQFLNTEKQSSIVIYFNPYSLWKGAVLL